MRCELAGEVSSHLGCAASTGTCRLHVWILDSTEYVLYVPPAMDVQPLKCLHVPPLRTLKNEAGDCCPLSVRAVASPRSQCCRRILSACSRTYSTHTHTYTCTDKLDRRATEGLGVDQRSLTGIASISRERKRWSELHLYVKGRAKSRPKMTGRIEAKKVQARTYKVPR